MRDHDHTCQAAYVDYVQSDLERALEPLSDIWIAAEPCTPRKPENTSPEAIAVPVGKVPKDAIIYAPARDYIPGMPKN